jgi:stringent starvation protein B
MLLLLPLGIVLVASSLLAQENSRGVVFPEFSAPASLDQQSPPESPQQDTSKKSSPAEDQEQPAKNDEGQAAKPAQQPQRILGVICPISAP